MRCDCDGSDASSLTAPACVRGEASSLTDPTRQHRATPSPPDCAARFAALLIPRTVIERARRRAERAPRVGRERVPAQSARAARLGDGQACCAVLSLADEGRGAVAGSAWATIRATYGSEDIPHRTRERAEGFRWWWVWQSWQGFVASVPEPSPGVGHTESLTRHSDRYVFPSRPRTHAHARPVDAGGRLAA
jgi:hypothetical protein